MSILSEQIALEIDQEILGDLVRGATAGLYYGLYVLHGLEAHFDQFIYPSFAYF